MLGTRSSVKRRVTAPRRERVYLPTILYREIDGARAPGAERLVAHRLQGRLMLIVGELDDALLERVARNKDHYVATAARYLSGELGGGPHGGR